MLKILVLFFITVFIIFCHSLHCNKVREKNKCISEKTCSNDESSCKIVSSRGFMKLCDFYPEEPKSSIKIVKYDWKKINNFYLENQSYPSIYINTSALKNFFENDFKNIKTKFVLVSGDADETLYEDVFENKTQFLNFLNEDKVIHWFAQNFTDTSTKISQIPIGLDYHTLSPSKFSSDNSRHQWGDFQLPIDQEKELLKLKNSSKTLKERNFKIYCNFHFQTNTKYGFDRIDALKAFESSAATRNLVYLEPTRRKRVESWKKQSEFMFVASPHGNGYDCHRTWEALALGCIPIVKTSGLDNLYKQFQICIVKDWSEITDEFLIETIERFNKETHKLNVDSLFLSHWKNKIDKYKNMSL